jgi:hypothetical protein
MHVGPVGHPSKGNQAVRRILLATTTLAVLLGNGAAVAAPTLPAEFHGSWCGTFYKPGLPQSTKTFPFGKERQDFVEMSCETAGEQNGTELEIDAQGFETGDMRCHAIEVQKFNRNNYRKGILNPWGPAYRVKFRCEDEGFNYTTKAWTWQIQKGYIVVEAAK